MTYKLIEIPVSEPCRIVALERIMPDGQKAAKVVALGTDRSEQAACLIQAKRDLRQFTDSTWRNS